MLLITTAPRGKPSRFLLTNNSWLQVNEHGARNVFSCSSLAEKRVEGIVSSADSLVARHCAIRLNSMLQAVQLPTSISNLNSGLANVDRDTFTLWSKREIIRLRHYNSLLPSVLRWQITKKFLSVGLFSIRLRLGTKTSISNSNRSFASKDPWKLTRHNSKLTIFRKVYNLIWMCLEKTCAWNPLRNGRNFFFRKATTLSPRRVTKHSSLQSKTDEDWQRILRVHQK